MHATRTAAFLLLDVLLVLCLCSMILCMHPIRLEFVSEWMRQCKLDAHAWVLPYLLIVIMILIVGLQLNWMFLVSLHHLHAAAQQFIPYHEGCCPSPAVRCEAKAHCSPGTSHT
jgi:hypothetical protein